MPTSNMDRFIDFLNRFGHYHLQDKPWRASGITLVLMALALAMRLAFVPLDGGLEYVFFFPAVVMAAVLGGWRQGLLAGLTGAFMVTWIFFPPYWDLVSDDFGVNIGANLVFLIGSAIVSVAIEAMHHYRQRYATDNQTLHRFQDIIQSTDDAVVSKSLQSVVQSWNPAAERMFGYSAAEAIGSSALRIYPPQRLNEEGEFLARIGAGQRIEHFESQRLHKDGHLVDVSISMSPLYNTSNQVIGVSVLARDISQRKSAQRLIDTFFAMSLDLMCVAGADGYLKRVNPGFTLALGWSEAELLARPYIEFVHPDDIEPTRRAAEQQIERGERLLHFENRYQHKAGDWRTLSWVSAPGGDSLLYATARDITDDKIKQQQLADSATRIQTILDSVADGVITIDEHGVIESFNPAAETIFGYNTQQAIGQNVNVLMPEPQHTEHDAYLHRFLASHEPHILGNVRAGGMDTRGLRKDGSTFPVSLAVNEMVLGGKMHFTGIVRDITERKQVEQTLLEAKDRAELASKVKASFLASMSHEIRTPLGGMLGMLELLSLSELDREQLATLETAWASGRGLLRIVNDILDWSKIEEGKLHIVPTPAALGAVLQDVVNTYSRVASAKSLRLWKHVDSRLVHVYLVDVLRLSQVLNNFVSNAVKFTERGEIEVRAELLEETSDGDTICFSVKDTGIGMTPEEQQKIFQNYVQANAETARMYGGTGLGLAICRSLADMMGGDLALSSMPRRGSTFSFTLTLPRTDAPAEPVTMRPVEVAQRAVKPLFVNGEAAPLVLVVDDHPTNRDLLARQVKILGLRATTAENGRVAVSLWRDGRFAMVITDCHMPDMDGYEMARVMRNMERSEGRARTPIIAWTANALSEEIERISAAGMDELLVKPVNLQQLRSMLTKWLQPQATAADDGVATPGAAGSGVAGATETVAVPLDRAVLAAIMTDPAEQHALLTDFVQHISQDSSTLSGLLALGDSAALQSTAHRMKGSCRMVGAQQLGNVCADMEAAAKAGNPDAVRALQPSLEQALDALVRLLAAEA